MVITLTGKIVECLDKKSGTSKNGTAWASQDFVIEEENGDINVFNVFGQDRLDEYGIKRGMMVSATCSLKAKEWQGRYFTSLSCTKCFVQQNASQAVQQERKQQAEAQLKQDNAGQSAEVTSDELPF